MAHLALYREFRPQSFADVVGQQHITRTLRNALIHQRINHAYLLSGPRGTGKTTVARIIAKAVNCLNPSEGEPCNECEACRSIISGETMDIIEIDAASNRGVDEIRDLRDKVKYAPADLKYKVYIIDEVHMLTEQAFNALLKTLEEPPQHVLFLLATTERHKLPVTIVSRCQCFDYHRLSALEIIGRLESVCHTYGLNAAPEALAAIARQAEGGMRDALSLLDQVMAYAVDGQITIDDTLHVLGSAPLDQFLKLADHLLKGDVGLALLLLDELVRQGKDLRQFVRDFLAHLRDMLLVKVGSGESVLDLPAHSLALLKTQAAGMQQGHVLAAIKLFAQLESDMRFSASPRLLIEVALIRIAGLFSGQAPEVAEVAVPAAIPARKPAAASAPASGSVPAPAARTGGVDLTLDEAGPGPSPLELRPAAPTEPPVPTGEGVERVLKAWNEILDLVKRARPSTHTLLAQTRVGRVRGNAIFLVASNGAFAELLKRPADKTIVEKAFAKMGLTDVEIQVVGPDHAAAKAEVEAGPSQAPSMAGGQQSLLERARSIFPKELVTEITEEGS